MTTQFARQNRVPKCTGKFHSAESVPWSRNAEEEIYKHKVPAKTLQGRFPGAVFAF
jgi:hypothetical protein